MMKQAFFVLALIGLGFSAPQSRKLFHEHFEDFLSVIIEESGNDLEHLLEHYLEYEEFVATLQFIETNNFKELVYEMEELPEFIAVIDFLERDNIDVHFFIDMFNDILENGLPNKKARHTTSGKDLKSFINDGIALFPKERLAALYEEKMTTDEEFNTAITNLMSEEWTQVSAALWESEAFLNEVNTLRDNGLDVVDFFNEIIAIFGQN